MTGIVVAYGTKYEMGAQGDLPWKRGLPSDLAHFQKMTRGRSVIMGRATFESIDQKPLPDRQNIVVTSHPTGVKKVLSAQSLGAALALCQYDPVIIGGVRLFEEALDEELVDTIIATEINATFAAADRFFPSIDMSRWQQISREHFPADDRNVYDFDIVTYRRLR